MSLYQNVIKSARGRLFLSNLKARARAESRIASAVKVLAPSATAEEQVNSKVSVVFYHIPKSAGTSFKESLVKAFGYKRCFFATQKNVVKNINKDEPIKLPKEVLVLGGHFHAKEVHTRQFPNAKRIVWLREPLSRAFSEMNHILRHKVQPGYGIINNLVPSWSDMNGRELFETLLKDPKTCSIFKVYARFLGNVEPDFFDFIGCVENLDVDLKRCSTIIGKRFEAQELNIGSKAKKIDFSGLEHYLEEDIKIYNKFKK